jgi:hypothetical protein
MIKSIEATVINIANTWNDLHQSINKASYSSEEDKN